jgi:hypothetical protein
MKAVGLGMGVLLLSMIVASPAIGAPFNIQGASYPSKDAFVETGRRCATEEPSEYQLRRIDETVRQFRSKNAAFRQVGGVVEIPIQFHVLQAGESCRRAMSAP